MKIVKISATFLAVAIILGVSSIFAEEAANKGLVGVYAEIKAGKTFKSDQFVKGDNFIPQSYEFQKAMTTLTNPCPKCNFTVSLYKVNESTTSKIGSVLGKTGEDFYFDNKLNLLSSVSGVYYLTIKRSDLTAVTSWETGDWYIEKENKAAEYQN